jgi:hypothetical protein
LNNQKRNLHHFKFKKLQIHKCNLSQDKVCFKIKEKINFWVYLEARRMKKKKKKQLKKN